MEIPDNPIITCYERTGYSPYQTADEPFCPVCGSRCENLYRDRFGDIVGCDECVAQVDPWDWMEEQAN